MPWSRSLVAVGNGALCCEIREIAVLTVIQDRTQGSSSSFCVDMRTQTTQSSLSVSCVGMGGDVIVERIAKVQVDPGGRFVFSALVMRIMLQHVQPVDRTAQGVGCRGRRRSGGAGEVTVASCALAGARM